MYRIELTPGEEALFRNIDELAKGIQNGVISPTARVWHAASNKWLPIDFHPHYKIARERPVPPPTAAVPVTTPLPAPSPFAPPKPAPAPAAAPTAPAAPAAPVVPKAAAPTPVVPPAPTPVREVPAPPKPVAEPVAASAPPAPKAPATPAPALWIPKSRELQFIELAPTDSKPAAEPVAPLPIGPLLEQVSPQPTTPRHIEALVAIAEKSPLAAVEPQDEPLIDIRPPRRPLKLNLKVNPRAAAIAAGVLLLAAAGGALVARGSADPAAEPESHIAVASTSLAATPQPPRPAPEPIEPSVAFRGNRAAEPVEVPETPVRDTAAPVVPRAPSLKSADLMAGSSAIVADTYDPQVELETRLRAAGFAGLFAPSRLAAGTISSTRLAVAGASGLVRKYREKATAPESNAGARTADALLSDIDAVLGILVGQEGGYEVSEGAIRFRDSASARQYGVLQARIASRLAAGSAGSPVVESLARVLGPAKLPASGGVMN